MSNVIPFRKRHDADDATPHVSSPESIEQIAHAMRHFWALGKRGHEYYNAVRAACPGASLSEYNTAADLVWRETGSA